MLGAYVTGPLPWPKNASPPAATRLTCQGASETLTVGETLDSVYVTSMAPLSGTGVNSFITMIAESGMPAIDCSPLASQIEFAASAPPV